MDNFSDTNLNIEAEFFFQQGLRQNQAQKYLAAIALFDLVLKYQPDYVQAWSERGIALGKLGYHQEAVTDFDKALSIQPNACWIWHNRGIALGKLSQYIAAVESFDHAIECNPKLDGFLAQSRHYTD